MNLAPITGETRFLGEWRLPCHKITLYASKSSSLWATVQDNFGRISSLSSEQIHGGLNRNLSSHKLIRMIEQVPHEKLAVILRTLPNLSLELNIFPMLQAAGLEDESNIEQAKKLVEKARQHRKEPKFIFDDILEFYLKALELFREVARKKQINVEVDLQTLEKEIVEFHHQHSVRPAPGIDRGVASSLTSSVSPLASSSPYLKHIRDVFDNKPKQTPELAQAQVYYVPLMTTTNYRSGTPTDLEEKVLAFLDSPKSLMLIQGDSGSGKSTFIHYFADKLWKSPGRIPLVIELKNVPQTLENFFGKFIQEEYRLLEEEMQQLYQQPTLILFDGFDEMPGQPYNLFTGNALRRWKCKVIITCRHEFLVNKSYHPWFVTDREFYKECEEIFIAPFSPDQTGAYLN